MITTFSKKKIFIFGGFILLLLVVLPVTLYMYRQNQVTNTEAEKTVNLTFAPGFSQTANALYIPAGSTFTLDVYLDPGANSVSFVKLETDYDATKFAPAGGFIPDQNVFSQIVESVDQPGKITATLSVGSDLSKAVKVKTKIGTLALKALDNAPTTSSVISFGPSTQALSVSSNSSYNENVIANQTPVTIQINKPQTSCGTSPGDSMLVMDTSGSMNDTLNSSSTKIATAISAANNYVDIVSGESNNRVGLVNFASTATLDSPLTNSFSTVKTQVSALKANGDTCIQCGIDKANQEIATDKRASIKNAVIILTDGMANRIESSNSLVNPATADQAALTAAANGHNANGTVYYTIGLGQDVDSSFLTKLAESTGGQYYYSPTTDQLNSIYNQIAQIIAGGSVTGTVFNDANSNGVFEPTEPGLPGVLLQLYTLGSSTPQQIISTDSDGTYTLQNVCNGTYTITQTVPTTWKQTLPSGSGYTFTISNGSSVSDKNFGDVKLPRCSDGIDNDGNGAADRADSTCHTDGNPNNPGSYNPNLDGEHGNSTCSDSKDNNGNGLIDGEDPTCHVDGNANNPSSYDPTRSEITLPTPTPTTSPATPTQTPTATAPTLTPQPSDNASPTPSNGTAFALNILLHNIGSSGDNATTAASFSNKTPIHPTRNAKVQLFDLNNNLLATALGQVIYSSSSGSFIGTAYTPNPITAGEYIVKIWSDYHLIKRIPQILTLSPDQINQLPQVALVAGDVNNDDQLNILDYNLIMDCYSDIAPARACDDTKKVTTDLNDDGNVNGDDYELFIRELSIQSGD